MHLPPVDGCDSVPGVNRGDGVKVCLDAETSSVRAFTLGVVVPRGCKVTERARKLRRHVHGVHVRRTFDRVRHREPCTQKYDVVTLIAHTEIKNKLTVEPARDFITDD